MTGAAALVEVPGAEGRAKAFPSFFVDPNLSHFAIMAGPAQLAQISPARYLTSGEPIPRTDFQCAGCCRGGARGSGCHPCRARLRPVDGDGQHFRLEFGFRARAL